MDYCILALLFLQLMLWFERQEASDLVLFNA